MGFYPHIPHEKSLETMKRYLDKRKDQSEPSDSLYKVTKIILKIIISNVYHQILSTGNGTKFVLHYTNIFMAKSEKKTFSNTEFQQLLRLNNLDDIFCFWTNSIEKLKESFEFLNAFHPSIKFTMDNSSYQVNYLDVLITKDKSGKILCTRLNTKPTDTRQYLHVQS